MTALLVGNDVVDLTDPRCVGKSSSGRFMHRIFHPLERRRVLESSTPDRTLWLLWAAKEAAFKVESKIRGRPPPFVHAAFRVAAEVTARRRVGGTVTYQERTLPFVADVRPGSIHVVCWWGGTGSGPLAPPGLRWACRAAADVLPRGADLAALLDSAFSMRERGAVHSLPSAAVRMGARADLAAAMDVEARRLEIVCEGGGVGRTPPALHLSGEPAPVDLSLSHHHGLVAWAWDGEAARRRGTSGADGGGGDPPPGG